MSSSFSLHLIQKIVELEYGDTISLIYPQQIEDKGILKCYLFQVVISTGWAAVPGAHVSSEQQYITVSL